MSALFRRHLSLSRSLTHPYSIPRNSRGSLPVYTDIRSANTRYLVLIRNVDGNADALRDDLYQDLFPPESDEKNRLRIQVHHGKHLVLSGGKWKHAVMAWLARKGF